MRRGEILGLKWSDIDFVNEKIHVNRSLAHVPKKGYTLTTLKTKSSKRQIAIPEFILNELRTQKNSQDEWSGLVGDLFQNQDLVFCTHTGTVQDPRNVIRVMKRIIKIAKVRAIRFHDLRHTHASILIAAGVDIVNVSAQLGHVNPKITLEFYAHLLPNSSSKVADMFHNTIRDHLYDDMDDNTDERE
jgi:integrase